jgi:coproporphyrinogen III oxidase-like Fe-S oxidoreductase
MLQIQKLESEKYVQVELKKWAADVRRERNRKAVRDLTTFLAGLGMMAIGIYIAGQSPHWMPYLDQAFDSLRNGFVR